MPRTATAGELALLAADHVNHYLTVEVKNASGTWILLTAMLGEDWVDRVRWDGEGIDRQIRSATLTLRRDRQDGTSLSPFLEASAANVDDAAAYAPLLNVGRAVRIRTAVTAHGVAPITANWKEEYVGRITRLDAEQDPVVAQCSDEAGELMDTSIEVPTEYGDNAGAAVEDIMQAILDDWPAGSTPPTLAVPVSPDWTIPRAFTLDSMPVLQALNNIVAQFGWALRYHYDAADVCKLTLYEPPRDADTPVATISPSMYRDVRKLSLELDPVRNKWTGDYTTALGVAASVSVEDAPSIAEFKKRLARLAGDAVAQVTTEEEMLRMLEAALHDTKAPPLTHEVDLLYYWPAQAYDVYEFPANGVHYDAAQILAVQSVSHEAAAGEIVTTLQCGGRVVGAYAEWLRRIGDGQSVERSLSVLRVNSTESSDGLTRMFTLVVGALVDAVHVHYRTADIDETEDTHDFSATAVLPADAESPLIRRPVSGVVTFSLPQPLRDKQLAVRIVPYVGTVAGPNLVLTIDAAPPAINANIHATKIGALASLSIDIAFGVSDGPVGVAVIERLLGVPTTLLTLTMVAPGTIDRTTHPALGSRAIPANADSISWTVQLTDAAGNVWTFGPTAVLPSAVLINAVPVESAGVATVTVAVVDAGAYLDRAHSDAGVIAAMSWHVTRLGITAVVACTSVPGGGATTGTYTRVETLDPLHPIQLAGFVHYVDGSTECFGIWTFDSDKIADVVNISVANTPTYGTVTVVWDTDTDVDLAGGARYSLVSPTGPWTLIPVTSAYLSQFSVQRTTYVQTAYVQGKNAIDGTTWGNINVVEISALEVTGGVPPTPTIGPVVAEATAVGGTAQGMVHVPLVFEENTDRFDIYTTEQSASGIAVPATSPDSLSATIRRKEGVTASSPTWATMHDLATTAGWCRRVLVIPTSPTGLQGTPYGVEIQAADTGTGPSGPPTAFTQTLTTPSGINRYSLAWTCADAAAYTRVFRNKAIIAILAPTVASFVDDGLAPTSAYVYSVDHYLNGQTSAKATSAIITSGTPTLEAPTWVSGYPVGRANRPTGFSAVAIYIVKPDPLARADVYMDAGSGYSLVGSVPVGSTATMIEDESLLGVTASFYVVARRTGFTDSSGSAIETATFGLAI